VTTRESIQPQNNARILCLVLNLQLILSKIEAIGWCGLLGKNFVQQDTQLDGESRYMMLETIREYALEQLTVSRQRKHKIYLP
jgi:hypothetical protein